MKIALQTFYGGSREKICRLGLAHLFLELQEIIFSVPIAVLNEKQANGAAVVRKAIDEAFTKAGEWVCQKSGGIDWLKRMKFNTSVVARMGVEIQVSGRSDMLARDIVHLRNALQAGEIDVGVIVVPSDHFEYFLTDRVANFTYARRYIEEEFREAKTFPIVLLGIEHDGHSNTALPKQKTNRSQPKE